WAKDEGEELRVGTEASAVVVVAQGSEDAGADDGGVVPPGVVRRGANEGDGVVWKRKDLEAGPVGGDQVTVDECVADVDENLEWNLEKGAQAIVVIEAEALAVAGEHEQEVEVAFSRGERAE